MAYTKGPWEAETNTDFDKDDNEYIYKTGWIKNVVKYKNCGSHEALWNNLDDLTLVLTAPELLEVLKEIVNSDIALREQDEGNNSKLLNKVKFLIDKAEGKI